MSDQWHYMRAGKQSGPITAAELKRLASSGHLSPTDMVWRVGMAQWTAAASITELFPNLETIRKPPAKLARTTLEPSHRQPGGLRTTGPLPATQAGSNEYLASAFTSDITSQLSLGLAVFLSLLAAACALSRLGGDLLSPIIAILAIGSGLAAVWFSVNRNRALLGSAATAVFLAFAALLFSIGASVAERIIAKASEVEDKRKAAERDQTEAKAMRKEAQDTLDRVEEAPSRILKQAEAKYREAEKKEAANDQRSKKIAADEAQLADQRTRDKLNFEKRNAELTAKRASLEKDEKALARDRANLPVLARKAAEDRQKADAALKEAEQKNEEAAKKEKDAKDHYKRIMDEYKDLKKQLGAEAPEDRKKVINALARIGQLPGSANADLRRTVNNGINHELCEIAVSDPKLGTDARQALNSVEPNLGHVVAILINTPMGVSAKDYLNEIRKLSAFDSAGLPLVKAHFRMLFPAAVKRLGPRFVNEVLAADLEVLEKLAFTEHDALDMLIEAPDSRAGEAISKRSEPGSVHRNVGEVLRRLTKDEPKTRPAALPFFIKLLEQPHSANRKLAAEALGDFGPDAEAGLPKLKKIQADDKDIEVCTAARGAIEKIESKPK